VGRYVSEAWFGRRPAYPVPPEQSRPARPGLTGPAGVALIITGAVLLLAVSSSLSFLNLKLLGLILVIAGLVTVRAVQRVSGWLWRNRREVMTALDAPRDETAIPRVPLDVLLAASPPAARRAGWRARQQAQRQAAGSERRPGPMRRLGRLGQRHGRLAVAADQPADAGDRR
jgi:hypothetical protein